MEYLNKILEIVTSEGFVSLVALIAGLVFTKAKVDESTQQQIKNAAQIGMEAVEQLKSHGKYATPEEAKNAAVEIAMNHLPKVATVIRKEHTREKVSVAIEAAVGAVKIGRQIRAQKTAAKGRK